MNGTSTKEDAMKTRTTTLLALGIISAGVGFMYCGGVPATEENPEPEFTVAPPATTVRPPANLPIEIVKEDTGVVIGPDNTVAIPAPVPPVPPPCPGCPQPPPPPEDLRTKPLEAPR
jgi:hypothetical protein